MFAHEIFHRWFHFELFSASIRCLLECTRRRDGRLADNRAAGQAKAYRVKAVSCGCNKSRSNLMFPIICHRYAIYRSTAPHGNKINEILIYVGSTFNYRARKFSLHWRARMGKVTIAVEIKARAPEQIFLQPVPGEKGSLAEEKTNRRPATVFHVKLARPNAYRYLCLMAGELGRLRHLRPFSRFDDEFPMLHCRRCLSPTYTTNFLVSFRKIPQNFLDIFSAFTSLLIRLVNGLILGILCAHTKQTRNRSATQWASATWRFFCFERENGEI